MNFSFYLKDKKKADKTPIVLVISQHGKLYRKQIGISVRPSEFKKQRTKNESVNSKLRTIENVLNSRLNQFSSPDEIKKSIDAAMSEAFSGGMKIEKKMASYNVPRPCFWDYFREWGERDTPSKKSRWLAFRRVSDIMGEIGDWEDIDESWCFRFIQRCNDLSYSENYKATLIAKVKTVLIEGKKLKYHNSDEYKKFKYKWETSDSIALTKDEVDAIYAASLDGKQADARDIFIIGVYTASRFQTYSHLSVDNISDGMIHFVQQKTGGSVILPCSPKILEILGKHGGCAPKITEQEVGRHMKEICKGLGGSFNDVYEIRKSRGGRIVVERTPKWKLVSTHTARRTGATILHLSGVPDFQLMKITGHTTLTNFQKYLRITKEENARLLADNPFFQ